MIPATGFVGWAGPVGPAAVAGAGVGYCGPAVVAGAGVGWGGPPARTGPVSGGRRRGRKVAE
jgi:hypothetical protein